MIVFLAIFLLTYPQTIDEYVALTDIASPAHRSWQAPMQLILAGVFLLLLFPLSLWFTGRWLSYRVYGTAIREKSLKGYFLAWAPRIVAVLPMLILSWKLISIEYRNHTLLELSHVGWVFFVTAILLLFIMGLRTKIAKTSARFDELLFSEAPYFASAIIMPILVGLVVAFSPVAFPQFFGVIPFGLGFLIALIVLGTGLVWYFFNTKVPVLTLAIVVAGLFAFLDLSDNHEISLIAEEPNEGALPTFNTISKSFEDWLDDRVDPWIEKHERPFPVFIVAAEGGGIYAAQNAAIFLSRLEDLTADGERYSKFSKHIFAISALSGGAVGATVYGGLLAEYPDGIPDQKTGDKIPMETVALRVLERDLLSPVVANLVTLDFFQRFVPVNLFSDRAVSLERAILESWISVDDVILKRDTLLGPASGLWSAKEHRPALVLNTAEMNTGRAVASAPFQLSTGEPVRATFRELLKGADPDEVLYQPAESCRDFENPQLTDYRKQFESNRDLSAITAAVLSARFPYASPPGRLVRRAVQTCSLKYANQFITAQRKIAVEAQYIDGGYVEASSTEAALEIVRALERQADFLGALDRLQKMNAADRSPSGVARGNTANSDRPAARIKIHLVAISLGGEDIIQHSNVGEVLTPPMGLLATWGTRSKTALEHARQHYSSQPFEAGNTNLHARGNFYHVEPYDSEGRVPLGWRLSSLTSNLLRQLLSEPDPLSGQSALDGPGTITCQLIELVANRSSTSPHTHEECLDQLPFSQDREPRTAG